MFIPQALAQTTNYASNLTSSSLTTNSLGDYDVFSLVHTGIAWAMIIAALLSVIFIFVGGFSFILSGGQEDKVKQAVSTIRYAIIGLMVTILAITVVNFIGTKIFGVDLVFVKFQEIIDIAGDIIQNLGSGTGGTGLR